MTNFPSPMPPDRPPRKRKRSGALIAGIIFAVILAIVLLFLIPELFVLLAFIGLILGIIGLVRGRVPWLKISGKKNSAALAGTMAVLFFVAGGIMGPQDEVTATTPPAIAEPIVTTSESPSPSPTAVEDYIGKACESDELVMEQGTEKLYCDENPASELIWVTSENHDKAVVAAQKKADEKAAAEKKAEEKAAAEKKAAEKKAQEKAAAQKKAAEKAAAEKKEAQLAKQEAEAEKARLAEIKAEEEAYQAPPPAPSSAYYANCTAVRAAGADPIYAGDPGYSRKLDRDGDGVGCE